MKITCFIIAIVMFIIATIYLFKCKYIKGNKKKITFKTAETFLIRLIYIIVGS